MTCKGTFVHLETIFDYPLGSKSSGIWKKKKKYFMWFQKQSIVEFFPPQGINGSLESQIHIHKLCNSPQETEIILQCTSGGVDKR